MTKTASKAQLSQQPATPARTVRARVAKKSPKRRKPSPVRREAILAAALDEFATNGFAAARLDDVARRAGVAKGTIYVHFRDKETLFEELVRSSLGPLMAALEEAPAGDLPLRLFAERLIEIFVREIFGTRRKDVVRLVISEGPRFPALAAIYYREVISRAVTVVRAAVQRAIQRGEINSDALVRFPQLLVAPGIMAVVWDALFSRFDLLDVQALMRTHLDLLFAALERKA